MPNQTFAAVIPVFNGERFLRRAVRSVQRQSHPPTVIAIVDDCSTDGTMALARALANEDARIHVIPLQTNGGPSAARNTATRNVDADWMAFLDADDVWEREHVEQLAAGAERVHDASVIFAQAVMEDAERSPSSGTRQAETQASRINPFPRLWVENFVPQSAVAVRRAVLLDAGGYAESLRFGEDFDLWLRLANAGHAFVEVPTIGCVRTSHEGQVSARNATRMYESGWATRQREIAARHDTSRLLPPELQEHLRRAMEIDLQGAWATRNRAVLRDAIRAMQWVPGSVGLLSRWRRKAHSQWMFWFGSAWLWDRRPRWLRRPVAG